LKIIIVTQNAPVYLAEFLDNFLQKINGQSSYKISGVVLLKPFFKESILLDILDRFRLYGMKDFLKMLFIIVSNKFSSIFSYRSTYCYSIENFLKKYEIKVLPFEEVNSKALVDFIKLNNIDLIISIASPKIFKETILSAPNNGCINYHTSLLPRYRGRQPLFWALCNNEKKTGITIHEMDSKLDNGPIVYQKSFDILATDSLHDLYMKSIQVGADALFESLEIIKDGKLERQENNIEHASYFGFPKKEDAIIFRNNHKKFF
jgi:methionyl-tRNA formyltransferase